MSNNIIQLNSFRGKLKRQWLKRNSTRIDVFFSSFIKINVPIDFADVSAHYLTNQASDFETSWDYIDLRELMLDAFETVLGDLLFEELKSQQWFEARFMSRDDALERCLSTFILGDQAVVAGE